MNILIINHYAGSPKMGMEFRPYYFAKEWIKMGHNVSIVAGDYSHLRRENPTVVRDFQEEIIEGIKYYWVKTGSYGSNGVKRALTMFRFVRKLWFATNKLIRSINPDVVICSSTYPIDTYVGNRIKKKSKKNVKLVHEIHDMWPLTPIELGGMSPKNPFIRIMQHGEDYFCTHSDVIISLLPNAKEYLVEHGMSSEKFNVVMNGVVLEDWENPQELPVPIQEHFNKVNESNMMNLCYCGSIHKSIALEYLIDAVSEKDSVYLTLIGPGFDRPELEKRAEKASDRIKFFDPISKKCIPNVFKNIDVFFVGSLNYPLNRFGMCMNKVFDAMMGGKPILYAVDAPNNYIDDYNCGVTVNAEDTQSIIEGLNKIEKLTINEREAMGKRGTIAAKEYFDYELLAKQFIDYLNIKS